MPKDRVYGHEAVFKGLQYGLDIQAGTTAENRLLALLLECLECLMEVVLILGHVVGFPGIADVNEEMGDIAIVIQILSRANIHIPVYLS